jgi:hypothetical protein
MHQEDGMARGSTVSSSGFGQFMSTTAGRAVRVVAGVGLIAWGLAMGDAGGYVLAAVGLVPLAAGALDRCLITGLAEGRWTGDSVRACASRGA